MQELSSVERHLLQAKARALTGREKTLSERKQALCGYESVSLPPGILYDCVCVQSNLRRKDTLGAGLLSFVRRLSLSRRFTHISITSLFTVKKTSF